MSASGYISIAMSCVVGALIGGNEVVRKIRNVRERRNQPKGNPWNE